MCFSGEFNPYVSDSFTMNQSGCFFGCHFLMGKMFRDIFRDFDKLLEKSRKALFCQRRKCQIKRIERSSRLMLASWLKKELISSNFTAKDERHYEFRILGMSRCSWNLALLTIVCAGLSFWGSSSSLPQREETKRDIPSSWGKDYLWLDIQWRERKKMNGRREKQSEEKKRSISEKIKLCMISFLLLEDPWL